MKLRHEHGLPVHGVDYATDDEGRLDAGEDIDLATSLLQQDAWLPDDDEARALKESFAADKYGRMRKPDLVAEAEARGIDATGKVDEIRARLVAADEAGAAGEEDQS